MKFDYQARTNAGEIRTGLIESSDKENAFKLLKTKGLYVTFLQQHRVPIYGRKIKFLERVTRKEIVLFSRQLSIMFKSRVPLVETLQTLAKQTKNEAFQTIILKIADDIKGGSNLSKAFANYPKLFSAFYINMIRAGEASGKLNEIFSYLADYLERDERLRGKVKAALTYPIFVIVVFTAVVSLIVVYIIPQLSEILAETEQELPWITQLVMSFSNFMRHQGLFLILGIIVLIIAISRIIKTPSGKRFFDEKVLKIPFLNTLLRKIYLTQFALNLSTLISGGLLLNQSLEITADIVNNYVYKDIITRTKNEVKKGENMSFVLSKYPRDISPLFIQMIVVGEKTGTLGTSLQNIVNFYQEDVDNTLEAAIKLLEPVLIILLAVVVGGIVASVMIPIFTISMGQM
ncbi:MAG: type II secretion system F family protein [Candidatus Pacebacteria bacterium]|nr:type II secretion system F family protein [Candidatus Paceibacterota bacterium]